MTQLPAQRSNTVLFVPFYRFKKGKREGGRKEEREREDKNKEKP